METLFSQLGINWKLLLAQAFNFLLVLFILKKFVFPPLLRFIEAREQRIKKGLELTDKAEKDVERLEMFRKSELEKVKRDADAVLAEARILAQQKKQEMESDAKESAENIIMKAKLQAQKSQQDMVIDAKDEIGKAAFAVAEKIIQRNLTDFDEEKAVEDVLDYLNERYAPSSKQS
jgi:F-type H+-transporting ATPase subunit b